MWHKSNIDQGDQFSPMSVWAHGMRYGCSIDCCISKLLWSCADKSGFNTVQNYDITCIIDWALVTITLECVNAVEIVDHGTARFYYHTHVLYTMILCHFNRNVATLSVLLSSFLAATKQLYKWYFLSVRLSVCPSVCLSVCLSHLFDYVPIIVSSWNFQELLPVTKVTSMQKVKVRGQRSRSQRSQPNLTVSGL